MQAPSCKAIAGGALEEPVKAVQLATRQAGARVRAAAVASEARRARAIAPRPGLGRLPTDHGRARQQKRQHKEDASWRPRTKWNRRASPHRCHFSAPVRGRTGVVGGAALNSRLGRG